MRNFVFIFFLLWVVPVFAEPELLVNWQSPKQKIIELKLTGEDPDLDKCLNNGLEIRYRYEAKLCNKTCAKKLVETRFLSWDPISKSYRIEMDRHRDNQNPEVRVLSEKSEALKILMLVKDINYSFWEPKSGNILRARAFSECHGEYSSTLKTLSYYLSLGLIRLGGFNTGWNDYHLFN